MLATSIFKKIVSKKDIPMFSSFVSLAQFYPLFIQYKLNIVNKNQLSINIIFSTTSLKTSYSSVSSDIPHIFFANFSTVSKSKAI